jgi:hypothetical protein
LTDVVGADAFFDQVNDVIDAFEAGGTDRRT